MTCEYTWPFLNQLDCQIPRNARCEIEKWSETSQDLQNYCFDPIPVGAKYNFALDFHKLVKRVSFVYNIDKLYGVHFGKSPYSSQNKRMPFFLQLLKHTANSTLLVCLNH